MALTVRRYSRERPPLEEKDTALDLRSGVWNLQSVVWGVEFGV
jgi:hypothetical protein